jgi:putative ABC transport system substrate-binding protein
MIHAIAKIYSASNYTLHPDRGSRCSPRPVSVRVGQTCDDRRIVMGLRQTEPADRAMRRRELIGVACTALFAWPAMARAQQPTKVSRVGYLRFSSAVGDADRVEALRAGLRALGHVEGRNLVIEYRRAETIEQLQEAAAELARMSVDVIFATSSTETERARQATNIIPIVFATHADPVGLGHVASLSRPGGNITGLSVSQSEVTGKAVEILKEMVPHARRFGVLWTPTAPSGPPTLRAAEVAGERLGIQVKGVSVLAVEDFAEAFAAMARARADAVLVHGSALTARHNSPLLAQLALKHRLPSMFQVGANVLAGGLICYTPDHLDLTRRSAVYIDKILKGSRPADLPVEQASKYKLVINLKTAKALGLTIPPSLLLRADQLIE